MSCIACPHVEERHKENIGDLTIVRAIHDAFKVRDLVKLEKEIDILWRRIRERHQNQTGR